MFTILTVILISASVSECLLPREYRAQKFKENCVSYGFVIGTTEFAQCMQTENANWGAASQQNMQNLQNTLKNEADRRKAQTDKLNNQNRQVNCTTRYYGNTARTTCN